MEDLRKVSSIKLYAFWKNLSLGLLVMIGMVIVSKLLPYFFSPIVALIAAAILYTMVYNNRITSGSNCMLVVSGLLVATVTYSFLSILVNIFDLWQIWPFKIPRELSFFSYPFIPTLYIDPICFVVLLIIALRRRHLSLCVNCKLTKGDMNERGKIGRIFEYESILQLKNLIVLFGLLSVACWLYYLYSFVDAELNQRDIYVFVWLNVIVFGLDELYFGFRYYNLYLDLKENNEIITQEELQDMTSKTYLRYYVICGNYIYMDKDASDPRIPGTRVIDTPFVTNRSVSGITIPEVNNIIRRMTGVRDGDMRFFFGRKNPDIGSHSILRYFYFLEGNPEDYPELNVRGEWMDFEKVKRIYSFHPEEMSTILVSDITRMATIILTQKTFDSNGFRKNKLKSYRPSFNLTEISKGTYDFQDDKWIRISLFNSDTPMFRIKRWWRSGGRAQENKSAR